MAVPELRRIDPVPGLLDEIVAGKSPRQLRVAGIPESLLGPIAPGGRACCRGGDAQSS
ncbi:MAG TPA: hypothetical protein VNP36_12715 [Burkholderiales bacterium]|nr:hypothetical protein [Burkholderiales bacterium]